MSWLFVHAAWRGRSARSWAAIVGVAFVLSLLLVAAVAFSPFGRASPGNPPAKNQIAIVSKDRLPATEPARFKPIAPADARAINAALPIFRGAGPAAQPFPLIAGAADAGRAQDCLAAAAFFEAGDDAEDERAVVQVVLNRVRHPAFPKTVCGVVFQGAERRTGCQFTFTCDGSMARRRPSLAAWDRARAVAAAALGGAIYAPVGLATHYHADWVVPYWSTSLEKVAQIGPHIFYRWAGWWGTSGAYRGQERGEEPAVALLNGQPTDIGRGVPSATMLADGTLAVHGSNRPAHSAAGNPDLFLIQLTGSSDAYRTRAEGLCAGHEQCTVLGWSDPRLVARSTPLTPEQMNGLRFRYVSNGGSNNATALWDCTREAHRNKAECMPSGPLLAALTGTT